MPPPTMQRIKALLAPETKAGPNGQKVFTFIASTASVDRQGESVQQGAAWKLDAYRQSPVVVDSHDYRSIENVIGKAIDLRATDKALEADITFNGSPKGRLAEQLVEDGSVRAVSVGFMPLDFQPGKADGDVPTHMSQELLEISLVAVGANRDAVRIAGFEDDAETRAEWDTAFINSLPDSAFAVILSGGEKDEDGRTTPRSLRKLPHHGMSGAIDMPHLRNALARESQTDMPEAARATAHRHLMAHAEAEHMGERSAYSPADGDDPPYSATWEAVKDLAIAIVLDADGYAEGKRRALFSSLARLYRTLGRTSPEFRSAEQLSALTDAETKGLFWEGEATSLPSSETKAGRVLSRKNEGLIRQAHASLTTVLEQLGAQEPADEQADESTDNGKALDLNLDALRALVAGLPGGSEG